MKKTGKRSLKKNIAREIKNTRSRFISIMAIIGISVGFFSGIKSACPSMIETARQYYSDNHLMDVQLVSTVGFDDNDIRDIADLDCSDAVMACYSADLIMSMGGADSVVRVYSIPKKTDTNADYIINEPVLRQGRMAEKEGECVIEQYFLGMSGYKLGDTVHFNPDVDGKNTLDYIKRLDYKIVGIVDSPLYLTYLRGFSTIGSGSIAFYMMLPSEEFSYERYTNVFVRTKASSGGFSDFSDEYSKLIDAEKPEFELLSTDCVKRFNDTKLSDAEKELSDAKKEYAEKKKEAEDKLADGERKLLDGEREYNEKIAKALDDIASAEKELKEGREQLQQAQDSYSTGIKQAKQKLTDAQQQYNEGTIKYNSAKTEYDNQIAAAQSKLDSAQREYDRQYTVFYSQTKPQAETKLTILKTAIDICNGTIDDLEKQILSVREYAEIEESGVPVGQKLEEKLRDARQKLSEYEKQYKDGTAQLEQGEKQLKDAGAQLEQATNEFDTKRADGAVALNDAKSQLDDAASKLETGRLEYETAMTTGMFELQAAQNKITQGEKELEQGKKELELQKNNGAALLKESREKLENGKYEAHIQLSDAQTKLRDADDKIGSLKNAKWYIYNRDDNPGYSGLSEDAERVDSVAKVFPLFFLIVAALVCLTTMSRMVEERRTEIGTLKALGYDKGDISAKYIIYAGTAGVSGCIIGGIAGLTTLPKVIVDTYGIMYTLPPTIVTVSWSNYIISSIVGILCICLVALLTCRHDLRSEPALLMRPKAPKPGKRILLEHITPLWKRMSFTSKVTARNIFRYKARFLMTVVGVAGCTALIVAAFGLRDSITVIGKLQYGELTVYDQAFALKDADTSEKKAYLMSQFHADSRFDAVVLSSMEWSQLTTDKVRKKLDIRAVICQDKDMFEKEFVLRDRKTHDIIPLTDDGVVINERAADILKISVGDMVSIDLADIPCTVKVIGLTENYAGNFLYITPEKYRELTGKEPRYGVVLTKLREDSINDSSEIAKDYMKNDDIVTVTLVADTVHTMEDMMSSLDFIVYVMIFCAGLLAVVVLYNLTNINISERVREIATIKVLGFYDLESANYIYRENIVLTAVGALLGLVMGNFFFNFIIESIQMDNVMFPKSVSMISYMLAFMLTMIFSMAVNFIMYFKMNRISMVESLKSID